MRPGSTLILGSAVGHRWPQIRTFARSLRASGCRAEVVLLVGRIDAGTRREPAAHAITRWPVHRLVDPPGRVVPTVHQYDRHPEAERRILEALR